MTSHDTAPGEKGPIIPKSANEALKPEKAPPPPTRSRRARSQPVIFMNFVMSVCDELVVLDFGRQIAAGAPETVRRDAGVIAAYLGQDHQETVGAGVGPTKETA